ncbi:MAG TPA: hypothetical protein VGG41_01420 [Solirubrobacteraceae bacterium]|jgi:hypothetical protein
MRIAWLGPFAAASALAEHGAAVAAVLARSCELEIWTEDLGPLVQTTLPVRRYSDPDSLAAADVVFYTLAEEVSAPPPGVRPGIVILARALGTVSAAPPAALGVVTHFSSDLAALTQGRLEPVVALEPEPVEAYGAALLEFLERALRSAPALELLDRLGGELAAMGATPNLGVYDAIASDFGRFLLL